MHVSLLHAGGVGTQSRIASQPWVTSIQTASNNGHTRWQVAVNNDTTAQKQLLPLVQADGDVTVLEFSRNKADLEQVFLNLTKGEHDVKR